MAGQAGEVKVAGQGAPPLCGAHMRQTTHAADCTTMAEVRAGVDALDAAIVACSRERMRYMRSRGPHQARARSGARRAAQGSR